MFPYNTYSSPSALDQEPNFSHFPWPFLDDVDDEQHQNLAPPATLVTAATNTITSNGDGDGDGDNGVPLLVQKKQLPWKRDRHSKIMTAQGLRDRRMRLSVKVARKFFDLQDKLDFDKASKTIEWLLNNSEPAIKELMAVNNNKYCISVSETNIYNKETDEITVQVTKPIEKRKRRRAVARESRDKARARARERTRQKIMASESTKQRCRDSAEADPDHNLEFPAFITSNNEAGNESTMDCYAMTCKKSAVGNNEVQNNPKANFSTNPNSQEHSSSTPQSHHPSSIFMTTSNGGQWNPSSIFGTTPNNTTQYQQNPIPNSIFMNTNALELGVSSPTFTATNSINIGFHSQFPGNHFLEDVEDDRDACEFGCILYYKQYSEAAFCHTCRTSRWEDGTQKPRKTVKYFPIIPRLQCLYMSAKTADHIQWHRQMVKDSKNVAHPADGESWKEFDKLYPTFAADYRNVRLALTSDGFRFHGKHIDHFLFPINILV